ncbi:UDP-N-acetylmuramate--L-alanine ligase [Cyclobacterium qasimii]|uniref:UDP-N-acetylmuramate--L-alanine ligase n=2 Tax=Cyclobacterium qasimii TaxID=1350429 RepID=S7WP06_9BACT|nr:UDP-N-acetylmuramate--L-alanine ligase [Cyclobacterium qasimii]EPR68449.1 UDP-N-acetylmuramate--alanine ligase [Cyclobacterium qasimii M12-11B]GEO23774.1 UDP-N-acetylmuramate--L-alanine ligase [Cyclobacterium qasimii]
MNLKNLHSVFFLGIGGIGMSAIARWFNHIGVPVYGYDKTPSPLTEALEAEGMQISYADDSNSIPEPFKTSGADKLIVWTPAVPQSSELFKYFEANGFAIKKRAAVLGLITRNMESVAIAGTHGKTTTSSMVAHLLKHAGHNTAAFLGGLTQNYKNNLILHDEGSSESPVVVVEADEFDRSFLHLHPDLSIVTSIDPDHLDIYGDAEQLMEGFAAFIRLTNPGGKLIIHQNAYEKIKQKEIGTTPIFQYGLHSGNIHADNIKVGTTSFTFDYVAEDQRIDGLVLGVPGFHNIENALAAIAVAIHYGLSKEAISAGIATYKGVKRRFEKIYNSDRITYIDDYAHHPEEIKAFLQSVKAMYPDKKITAVFQPHLFTRTRDFASGFSESLSLADEVILLDIYPAREQPIAGITSEMLLPEITSLNKCVISKDNLLAHLQQHVPEVLVTIGAGDIDRLVKPIEKWIRDDKE